MTCKRTPVSAEVVVPAPAHLRPYHILGESRESFAKRYVKELQAWVNEFKDFLEDHRSQDGNPMEVSLKYGCSECGADWDTRDDDDGEGPYCTTCGEPVDIDKPTALKESSSP